MSIPTEELLSQTVETQMAQTDRAAIESTLESAMAEEVGMSEEEIAEYIAKMSDEELFEIFETILIEQVKIQYAAQVSQQFRLCRQNNLQWHWIWKVKHIQQNSVRCIMMRL